MLVQIVYVINITVLIQDAHYFGDKRRVVAIRIIVFFYMLSRSNTHFLLYKIRGMKKLREGIRIK